MFNSDLPSRAELPSTRQLIRSTIAALAAAIAILVAIVLPAEYAIDPTGVGRALGLAEMGEIKGQLAEEAARDRAMDQEAPVPTTPPASNQSSGNKSSGDQRSGLWKRMVAQLLISPAAAEEPAPARTDETVVTLKPGEATEVKLVMLKGAKVTFDWTVAGGVVNYDLHGDGTGNSTSYIKDRGVSGAQGVLEAAFDGNHGWFWRNRGKTSVTVTLKTKGAYSEIKRLL